MMPVETALVALATFFATIGPFECAAVFAAITPANSGAERRAMAFKGTAIATGILLVIAFFGEFLLSRMGITLSAFRTAGGILLLLIGVDLVLARPSGGTTTTHDETEEAEGKDDISVFPLATPLIAGPGAMGAAILLMADTSGDLVRQSTVIAALVAMLLLTLVLLLIAGQVSRLFGVTGLNVVSRVAGVLLTALAVQFIFDGIRESGLIS